jgi:hypothetical protein
MGKSHFSVIFELAHITIKTLLLFTPKQILNRSLKSGAMSFSQVVIFDIKLAFGQLETQHRSQTNFKNRIGLRQRILTEGEGSIQLTSLY